MISRNVVYRYATRLTISECIQSIINAPWEYEGGVCDPLWYKCEVLHDAQLLVIFTGGQFRRIRNTQFIMDFQKEHDNTIVTLKFHKELFGLPPMTPPRDIDTFMKQRINATKI